MGPNPIPRRVEFPGLFATLAVGALLGGLARRVRAGGGRPRPDVPAAQGGAGPRARGGPAAVLERPVRRGRPARGGEPRRGLLPAEPGALPRPRASRRPTGGRCGCTTWRLVAATYAYGRRLGLTPWGGAPGGPGVLALRVPGGPRDARAVLPPDAVSAARAAAGRPVRRDRAGPSGSRRWPWRWGRSGRSGISRSRCGRTALVVVTGLWRVAADRLPWRRAAGLVAAVAWGAAVAAVQLGAELGPGPVGRAHGPPVRATWPFTRTPPRTGSSRRCPGSSGACRCGGEDPYFHRQGTSGFEAAFLRGDGPPDPRLRRRPRPPPGAARRASGGCSCR